MKRKLALLLAAVMTLSMLPMNVFAKTDNDLSHVIASAKDNTLLYDRLGATNPTDYIDLKDNRGDKIIEAAELGTNLRITFKDAVSSGDSFQISLTNAQWFFKSGATSTATGDSGLDDQLKALISATGVEVISTSKGVSFSSRDVSSPNQRGNLTTGNIGSTFNITANKTGLFTTSSAGADAAYTQGFASVYINNNGGVPYALAVGADHTWARVILLDDDSGTGDISIPLVIRTLDEKTPVTYSMSNLVGSPVTPVGSATVVQAVEGATVVTIAGQGTGRSNVPLEMVTIRETRPTTIGNGTFYIDAPTGYKFMSNTGTSYSDRTNYTETGGGLGTYLYVAAVGFSRTDGVSGPPVMGANMTYSMSSNNRRIAVTLANFGQTASIVGQLEITGLVLEPLNSNTWGDITGLAISDGAGTLETGISDYTFATVIGTRANWGVELKPTDAKEGVPTLYTGVISHGSVVTSGDKSYKLMQVTVTENAYNSWWTGRDTKLTLPDGVIPRAVRVTDKSNIDVLAKGNYADRYLDSGDASTYLKIDGQSIVLGDIRPNNLVASQNKKLSVSLDIWVSISTRMAGQDIELTLTGGGIPTDELPESIVVAHAVAPISIETKVSTVGIGRSNQATSDIIITEYEPGALDEGSEILLQVVDQNGNSFRNSVDYIDFTNATFEVTEGDLGIDGQYNVGSGHSGDTNSTGYIGQMTGALSIEIKDESTKPSVITISDVKVRTSTLLSTLEKDAYKVVVYGTAVARNFSTVGWNNGNFGGQGGYFSSPLKDAGFFADYVNLSGANITGGFDAEAQFTITTDPAKGDMYYEISGERFPIPADMAPRNENGVVLLSVRLVAEAFGCKVDWDPAEGRAIVTVDTGKFAEFTVGSSYMSVNGVRLMMAYDNGQLATADIYDDRMFIPVRFLGQSLGVADANITFEDGTVYFNRR